MNKLFYFLKLYFKDILKLLKNEENKFFNSNIVSF